MANKKISGLANSLTKATVAANDLTVVVDTSASESKKMTYGELMSPTDANFRIAGSSDNTKLVAFEVDGLTTATTRTLTVPDANTTLVGTDTTATLTNKTLTSPVINVTSDTTGDMYYRNSGGLFTRLPIGSAGQIIQVSAGGIPEYIANPAAADASTTIKGVVEEATQAETNAGTGAGGTGARLYVNPSTLVTYLQSQNIGTLSVPSGENLAASVPVYINPSDSSVYTAHGFKSLDSTSLNLVDTTSNKVAKLSDTQLMFLSDNGTTTLTITVYDINSGASVAAQTVTTAFDQTTASTATLPSATMCRLTDTTFVVFYAHTGSNDLYFRTGTISGATITMDTETAYPGSPDFCYGMTAVPGASNGKVVFTYFDMTMETGSGGDSVQTLSYLTVAANSVTVTTTVSYTLSSSGFNVAPQWSNCCFTNGIAYGLFSCKDGGGVAEVAYNYINTVNSVTASNQYTLNLESQTGAGVSAAYATIIPSLVGHNGKAYTGWATQNSTTDVVNTKTVLELTQVGCKIAYQNTTVRLNGDNSQFALRMFGNECGVIVSGFDDGVAGGYFNGSIYIQKDKIYGFYSGNTLGIRSNVPQSQSWYSNTKDEVVVMYIDNSNGYIKQWKLPTPVDGFITSAATAPANAAIFLSSATTSGLTANSPYFLKDTYTTIGDMSNTGTIPVGQALSTTLLNLNG